LGWENQKKEGKKSKGCKSKPLEAVLLGSWEKKGSPWGGKKELEKERGRKRKGGGW